MESNTFTLNIYVTGLALFVPEGEHTMHVLLPRIEPADESTEQAVPHAHEHHPATAKDGAFLSKHVHEARIYFRGGSVAFDGIRWTPVKKQTPDAVACLPDQVVKITHKVARHHIAPVSQDEVAAHLILQGGSYQQVGATLDFSVGGVRHKKLTNSLCWTIPDVPGEALRLDFPPMSGTDTGETDITLHPRDGVLVLHLMNLPEVEHTRLHRPIQRCEKRTEHHFSMLSVLFGGKVLPAVSCFEGDEAKPAGYPADLPGPWRHRSEKMLAKVIYTCMIAQADLA